MPARITINLHKEEAAARIRKAGDQALTDMRDLIIEDINQYVPVGGGEGQNGGGGSLRESAKQHSSPQAQEGKLTIRWDTPYAQYQHGGLVMHGKPGPATRTYGPDELKYTNAMARKEWTQYAEQQHQEEWIAQTEKRMSGYL